MTHGEIAAKQFRERYWLWPFARIVEDDIGWAIVTRRWMIRLMATRRTR